MIDVSSGAGQQQSKDFAPLPKGTVLSGTLQLKFDDMGEVIIRSRREDSKSERIQARIQIEDEQYRGRYVFDDFYLKDSKGDDATESDFIREQVARMAAILEHAHNAHENPALYKLASYKDLNGLPVVIKVGQRRNKQTGETHNTVEAYLSPNEESQHHDLYAQYISGNYSSDEKSGF